MMIKDLSKEKIESAIAWFTGGELYNHFAGVVVKEFGNKKAGEAVACLAAMLVAAIDLLEEGAELDIIKTTKMHVKALSIFGMLKLYDSEVKQ
jgi:hypothetical protein